jgi:hypothetical protein
MGGNVFVFFAFFLKTDDAHLARPQKPFEGYLSRAKRLSILRLRYPVPTVPPPAIHSAPITAELEVSPEISSIISITAAITTNIATYRRIRIFSSLYAIQRVMAISPHMLHLRPEHLERRLPRLLWPLLGYKQHPWRKLYPDPNDHSRFYGCKLNLRLLYRYGGLRVCSKDRGCSGNLPPRHVERLGCLHRHYWYLAVDRGVLVLRVLLRALHLDGMRYSSPSSCLSCTMVDSRSDEYRGKRVLRSRTQLSHLPRPAQPPTVGHQSPQYLRSTGFVVLRATGRHLLPCSTIYGSSQIASPPTKATQPAGVHIPGALSIAVAVRQSLPALPCPPPLPQPDLLRQFRPPSFRLPPLWFLG